MKARILLILKLALRNVRRQMRRSVLTAMAMVMGLALMVFSRAMATGGHEDWIDAGVRLGSGHLTVEHVDYRRSRRLEDRIPGSVVADVTSALEDPSVASLVVGVVPRLEASGLAGSANSYAPVRVSGVDAEMEAVLSPLPEKVVEGRYLEPGDRLHAFIGSGLSERLNIGVGRRLVLTGQDANGEISGQLVRVVGIFTTGIPEVDEGLVHIPRATAAAWLGVGDDVTGVAVLLESSRSVVEVKGLLDGKVDPASVAVLRWQETMPELDAAVRLDDWGDYIFNGILLAIVALAIVNTVLMSVLYRTREFGVMRALGMTGRDTGFVVFAEGLLLTAISGFVGMVLGMGVTWLFFRNGLDFSFAMEEGMSMSGVLIEPIIYPEIRFSHVVRSAIYVTIIGTFSSFYPAYHATELDVAEAIKVDA